VKQIWLCEKCCVEGSRTIPRGADVYSGVQLIAKDHHDKSAICHGLHRLRFVRIKAPGCSSAEWIKVREDARAKRGVAKEEKE
jgi:hypothetical protein